LPLFGEGTGTLKKKRLKTMGKCGRCNLKKGERPMELHVNDILTRITRYNLIRKGRMIYIDVHQKIQGNLAGDFIAVPNLVNIVAKPEHQGAGSSEHEALEGCLKKIKGLNIEDLFPTTGSGQAPAAPQKK
jgi:hypothetical protein